MSAGNFSQFLTALGKNESGNNYAFVSSLGYLGRFQFGEEALQAIGFYAGDGTHAIDFVGGWTAKAHAFGVYDKQGFLNSPAAQDAAATDWFGKVWADATQLGLHNYIGQTIGGIAITPSGILAGAHLVGVWNLKAFLESGGSVVVRDGYGTPVSEYVQRFGGFETPFSGGGGGGTVTPTPSPQPSNTPTAGPDNLSGGEGQDRLHGGEGNDVIHGGGGFDDLHGNTGDDIARGGAGDDWVVGGKDQDQLFGDEGHDVVLGNMGNDTLDGGDGNDVVRGGQGDDQLTGGAGADFVTGDRGYDIVAGGAGADVFHFFQGADTDRVMDFNYWEGDRVDVLDASWNAHQSGGDTIVQLSSGDQMVLVGVQLSGLPSDWIF